MSKPEWNEDTPKWANWLAMDGGGFWIWWEFKPFAMFDFWARAGMQEGLSQYAGRSEDGLKHWSSTLERRP